MPESKKTSLSLGELKPFLVPGLILILVILTSLVLVKPRLGEIPTARKEIKKEREKLGQLTEKVNSLEGLNEKELSERAEVTLEALPGEKDLPLLLLKLKSLAIKNRLGFQIGVDPGELATDSAEVKKEKLPKLEFKVKLFGQTEDLKEFLVGVEKIAPLSKVQGVKISFEKDSDLSESSLAINSFFLPLPQSLGSSEEPLVLLTPEEEQTYQVLSELDSLEEGGLDFVSLPSGKENPFSTSLPQAQD